MTDAYTLTVMEINDSPREFAMKIARNYLTPEYAGILGASAFNNLPKRTSQRKIFSINFLNNPQKGTITSHFFSSKLISI